MSGLNGLTIWVLTMMGALVSWLGPLRPEPAEASCVWCHVGEVPATVARDTVPFDHEYHLPVSCASCHVGTAPVSATDYGWCDRCHHREQPVANCVQCHEEGPAPEALFAVPLVLPGGAEDRALTFPHEAHEMAECSSCHGSPPGTVEQPFECAACHSEHHEAETVDCLGCHESPPEWAHEDVVVHSTCAGSICHKTFQPADFFEAPRSLCEACHSEFRAGDPLPEIPDRLRLDTLSVRQIPTIPSV